MTCLTRSRTCLGILGPVSERTGPSLVPESGSFVTRPGRVRVAGHRAIPQPVESVERHS